MPIGIESSYWQKGQRWVANENSQVAGGGGIEPAGPQKKMHKNAQTWKKNAQKFENPTKKRKKHEIAKSM